MRARNPVGSFCLFAIVGVLAAASPVRADEPDDGFGDETLEDVEETAPADEADDVFDDTPDPEEKAEEKAPAAASDEPAVPREGTAEEEAEPRKGVEDIKITGRRREELLQDAPVSVRAFDAQELQDRGFTQLEDIGRATANLRFDAVSGTNDEARVYIRGVGQDDFRSITDPRVGIYIDGVYLPRLQSALLDLLDVERIEVLRGPQGTLFGKNTVGGAIQIVTQRPEPEPGAQSLVRVGNRGMVESRAWLNFPLPGALEDKAFMRLSFGSTDQDGHVANLFTGNNTGDQEVRGGRVALRVLPTERTTFDFTWDITHIENTQVLGHCRLGNPFNLARFTVDNYTNFLEDCAESETLSEDRANANDRAHNDQLINGLRTNLQWLGDTFEVNYLSSFRWRDEDGRSTADLDYTPQTFIGGGDGSKDDHWAMSSEVNVTGRLLEDRLHYVAGFFYFRERGDSEVESDVLRQFVVPELQAQLPTSPTVEGFPVTYAQIDAFVASNGFNERVDELVDEGLTEEEAAAQATEEQANRQCCLGITGTTANLNNLDRNDYRNTSYAVYAQATLDLWDRLHLTHGLRFTYENKERDGSITRIFPDDAEPLPAIVSQDDDYAQWTPEAQLSYDVSEDFLAYFRYARGWKSGGFNEAILTDAALERGTFLDFDEETADSVELGVKTRWFDDHLVFNFAGYYTFYDDIQITTLGLNEQGLVSAFIQNAGEATIWGFEAEGTALFDPAWLPGLNANFVLTGGLGFTKADYKDFTRDEFFPSSIPDGCTSLRLADCGTTGLGLLFGTAPILGLLNELANPEPVSVDRSDLDFKNTPEWSLNLSAIYNTELSSQEWATFRMDYYFQDDIEYNTDNTIGEQEYSLLDFRLSVSTRRFFAQEIMLSGWVRNALDKRYTNGGLPLGDTTGADGIFFAEPRTYGFDLIARF